MELEQFKKQQKYQYRNFYPDDAQDQQFIYVSDGIQETVCPHFTFFHGRYVKVTGWGEMDAASFTGYRLFEEEEEPEAEVIGVIAEEPEAAEESPTEEADAVEEPVEESGEEPVEESGEEPVDEAVEESIEEPIEESIEKSIEETIITGILAVSEYETNSFKNVKPSGPSSKISKKIKSGIIPSAIRFIASIAFENNSASP